MIFLACFCISIIFLLIVIGNGKKVGINFFLLIAVIAIGNGGHYAVAVSQNLQEAILANKLAYVIGCFAPMMVFFIICNICRVRISGIAGTIMYSVQMIVYFSVLTTGVSDIFYKSVEYHRGETFAYLTKTYGFMHTVYLITMIGYTLAGIVVGLVSLNRKNVVSRTNVCIVLMANALSVGVYMTERFVRLDIELMPVVFVIALIIISIPLFRIYNYSITTVRSDFDDRYRRTGYIIFDNKLRYMSANEFAQELFPELEEWEIEVKIPGNGGRFNTFLRQPLMAFVRMEEHDKLYNGIFEYKDMKYRYQIGTIFSSNKRQYGYCIRLVAAKDIAPEFVRDDEIQQSEHNTH